MGKKKQLFGSDGIEDFDAEALEKDLPDAAPADADVPADASPATDAKQDIVTEDDNGANPSSTDGGELAAAAQPPQEAPEGVLPTAQNALGAPAAPSAGDDTVTASVPEITPPSAPASAPAEATDEAVAPTQAAPTDAAAVDSGVEAPKKPDDAAPVGEVTSSSTDALADAGKPDATSSTSSDSSSTLPVDSKSEDSDATEPEMPALNAVQTEAKPIAEVAGEETMGKFKDAGNLMTDGLAKLRALEPKLERLGDEAKARLAHLRHKASEALAALEAWFERS